MIRANCRENLSPTSLKQDRLGLLGDAVKQAFLAGAPSLAQIEARIAMCLISDAPQLTEISNYLLELGGKRVRPLLTALSARLFGMRQPTDQLIDAAAGIEMIHMATLLHDDIIDQSPTRRSKMSAYLRYGTADTLLTGDFLLVKAFGLCSRLDRTVIEATEQACVELTEGEVLEGRLGPEREVSLEEYLTIISKKTASLFGLSAKVGAHLGGAAPAAVDQLYQFGLFAGIAFQMVDDVLDIVADEDLLGKPSGTDLRQRTPSLINILWLASGDAEAARFFSAAGDVSASVPALLKKLRDSAIVDESRKLAEDYAGRALAALASVRGEKIDSETRRQLEAIVDYTLQRCM